MRWPEDLAIYRTHLRRLLDRIKAHHGEDATINVFPALPVSVGIETGRVRVPKADLPMIIYDRIPEGFVRMIKIRSSNS